MKELFDSKYFKWGLTAFFVIVAAFVFGFLVSNIGTMLGWVGSLIKIMASLIVGLVIAYLLNPVVSFFERKVYKNIKSTTKRRNVSIATTLVCAVALIATVLGIVIPQLLSSIIELIKNSDTYVNSINNFIKNTIIGEKYASNYNEIITEFITGLKSNVLPMAQDALTNITDGVVGFVSGFFNLLIGTVFAVYILANSRNFAGGMRKTMYAFFNVDKVNTFIDRVSHVNDIFLKFLVGKITDSSIVCLCTLLFLLICGFPYPLLIAMIIGVTDLIPYFGPYIGTVPSAILLAVVDPIKAVIFIAFIICMQQIDANFITPRIQSNATGLPSFWVLFAIMLFGGIFGVVGLLIGVPCFTIIYELVSEFIEENLKKKKLPTDTVYYESVSNLEEKRIKANLREE